VKTNLANQLKHVDAALSVLGQVGRRELLHKTEAHCVSVGSQADEPRAESAMGTGERSRAETQTHYISSRQKENRGGTAGKVGEAEGAEEEGWLAPAEPCYEPTCQGRARCMRIDQGEAQAAHPQGKTPRSLVVPARTFTKSVCYAPRSRAYSRGFREWISAVLQELEKTAWWKVL
jgi:hypothetical protein